jgi:hypothetical protein
MELKNMRITENEKIFREHLKNYYPHKYDLLLAMEQTKVEDNELKVSPT